MRINEIIVALDSLRFELEQWKLSQTTEYYDEAIAEALTILVDLDR